MIALLEFLYAASLIALIYPYIGYPIVLRILVMVRGAYRPLAPSEGFLPSLTLMISAYNESMVIDRKIRNARSMDYPGEKLQIIVVSDASSDGTDDIVRAHAEEDPRVQLCRQEDRKGKTSGLNQGLKSAIGDIVVFSDANAIYEQSALRELVAPMADSRVGYVVGAAHYSDTGEGDAQRSEGLYWRYELALKELESALGSVVGGDGAIYAIRRELYRDLREDDINDFVNPLQIVAAGYRGVFNPNARCFEEGADSFAKEFGRKRRIVNRSWRATRRYGPELLGAGNPAFIFQLISHKVVRWFAMPSLAVCFAANVPLALTAGAGFYLLSLAGLLVSATVAWYGFRLDSRGETQPLPVYVLYYFYLVNIAALVGIWDEIRGIRHSKWDHVRKSDA